MYTPTQNYGFKKPAQGDPAKISDLNDNMDLLDELLMYTENQGTKPFDASETVNAGAIRRFNHVTYKCKVDGTTGTWDASKWEATDLGSEIENAGGGASSLSDLTDTDIDTPTNGEVLTWDGTAWVNAEGTPAVTKTATGNPIEFTDGADAPLVKCVSAITGSQDLHGYDKPWVGGAGKNKLPMTIDGIKAKNTSGTWNGNVYTKNNGTFEIVTDNGNNVTGIKVRGTFNAQTLFGIGDYISDSTTTIIYSGISGGSAETYSININIGGQFQGDVYDGDSPPRQIPASTNCYYLIVIRENYVANDVMFYPMFRLSTETDPTFTPYSNICPITAYSTGEIEVRGKNLFNKNATDITRGYVSNKYLDSFGNEVTPSTPADWAISEYIPVEPNKPCAISGLLTSGSYSPAIVFYSSKSSTSVVTGYNYLNRGSFNTVTGANVKFLRFSIPRLNIDPVQIEQGTTATTYEPYKGTTHTTTYPSAIYRGSEDVVNGEVVTEWGMIDSYAGETLPGEWISDRDEYAPGTTPTTGAQVAYALATPTTSSVTPTNLPIKSLNGYNHIESSTGEMEIDYITSGYQPLVDLIQSSQHVYATTEQVVGKWVDGKDVYEKTYTFQSLPSVGDWTAFDEDCGIDTLVDYSLMYTRSNGQIDNTDDLLRVAYNPPNSLGDLCYYPGGVGATHITVRYTKSTATTRTLSKGSTEGLRAEISGVKSEDEEILKKDEKAIKIDESESEETNAEEAETDNED